MSVSSFADTATSGPLLLAVGASAIAGLVSFLSPCVLPLVPGYLSYVTGLAGADMDAALGTDPRGNPVAAGSAPGALDTSRVRGRIAAGSLLFIAGFTVVFTLTSVIAASIGSRLLAYQRGLEIGVGIVVIVLGAAFVGLIPGMQREFRIRKLPAAGLAGAPVLGAVFALSWVPCLSPTLGAVVGLSFVGGRTGRAVILAIAYCLGLGLPFLAFGLGFRRLLGVFAVIRRNSRWVTRIGGVLLLVIGLALVTGAWGDFVNWLRATVGSGSVGI